MNRQDCRIQQSALRRGTKAFQKTSAKLMAGDAGPWVTLTLEKLRESLGLGLAVQGARNGYQAVPGPLLSQVDRGWYNNHLEVMARSFTCEWGVVDHVWVKRVDGKPIRSWTDMMKIKRDLIQDGVDRTAVEVYPPEDEVMDAMNWYHLWVLPKGFDLPFSLTR